MIYQKNAVNKKKNEIVSISGRINQSEDRIWDILIESIESEKKKNKRVTIKRTNVWLNGVQ
jgi:hypothetical protein